MLKDISDPSTHQNIRIFILKLVINNGDLLKPYAKLWFKPVCNFIVSKKSGGKGFHYFLRDLTTLLISWSEEWVPDADDSESAKLCSNVLNYLIMLAADKSKLIFNINIEILATLMLKWKHLLTIDKDLVFKMLMNETKDISHLWKMTGI